MSIFRNKCDGRILIHCIKYLKDDFKTKNIFTKELSASGDDKDSFLTCQYREKFPI